MAVPTFQQFDPREIEWQGDATEFYENFDYSKGILELVFSGSIGSAKSCEGAHLTIRHLLENDGARCLVVRRVLKDLKRTIWDVLLRHIDDIKHVIKSYNKSEMKIIFNNGSELIADSYDKGDLEKFRSLELSMALIEEGSECNEDVYKAIKMRVGRAAGVSQNLILLMTNPDEPDHFIYEKLITNKSPRVKVFYSLTEQNKFLPKWYIENLREDLSQLEADRMLRGMWISIQGEKPYYAYDEKHNYIDQNYKWNEKLPLCLCFDFNIGSGKPFSAAAAQIHDGETYHIGKDFVIHGFRTADMIENILDSGLCDLDFPEILIYGDAAGAYRDTRGENSDYDILMTHLSNYVKPNGKHLNVKLKVSKSNPRIRVRQNKVNGRLCNDLGKRNLFVYKDCKMVPKGFKLTKIVKGANYIECDKDEWQHVISAIGYLVCQSQKQKVTKGGVFA